MGAKHDACTRKRGHATLITTSLSEAALGPLQRVTLPAEAAHATTFTHAARAGTSTGADPAEISLAQRVLDDAKAEDIVTIDLAGKTSIADAMIICSGRSDRHVGAIADQVLRAWKEAGRGTPRVEGMPVCDWVLIDAGDVIVHIFKPEVRLHYNLEKMWGVDRPKERMAG
jgi:ribosome-associated protein